MNIIQEIKSFIPEHDYFIGVDSDGCAFDTMEIKHKKVFIPLAIQMWNLEKIQKEFFEVAEFINLYSNLRGTNRFPALVLTFEYLKERPEVIALDVKFPDYSKLKEFLNSGAPLSNASLKAFASSKNSLFLNEVIRWSEDGDKLMAQLTKDNKPFRYVEESLQKSRESADTMVVSAASTNALHQEWGQCGLLKYMSLVAGQEAGPKKEQLQYAISGKYKGCNVLLLGDGPGDLEAAKANNVLFYPINPGYEEQSWKRFYDEAYDLFISGQYAGEYEEILIKEFLKLLPGKKPWGVKKD